MTQPTPSQQQAIDARGNVLVVAGAGAGKTSTLVRRCIALLETGSSLENILMVTFTDAAALEMCGRIREALQDKIRALENDGQAPAEQREHFDKQLALLDTALISTLHSFCLQIVREHFYELEIDPGVMVLDERQTRPLIQQTLEAIFDRHYAGATDGDKAVQSLVRAQGRGTDEHLRALVLKLHRHSQARPDPTGWIEAQRAVFHQTNPSRWHEWFVEGFQAWRELWLNTLAGFAGNPAVDLAVAALNNAPAKPTLNQAAQAVQAIRSADEDAANWPRGSKKNIRAHLEDFFDEAVFLASLAPSPGGDPLAEDWELTRHDMLALLDLTREFTTEFSRAKRELGGVDFADLEQFALRVLRHPQSGALTPVALHWRRQLDHVFVDEYQDINAAQDKIIEAISRDSLGVPSSDGKGAEPPEGGTPNAGNRFLVGDVKQSIYRFRLADPTIFRDYEQRWQSSGKNSQRLPLTENFRSRKGILDFVNPLFRALMRESIGGVAHEELIFGNATERAALAGDADGAPRVELHLIAKCDRQNGGGEAGNESSAGPDDVADLLATEREARLVALRLRELKEQQHEIWDKDEKCLRPAQWSDMAVLLRSPAGRVEAFAKEFAGLDVPLEAARGGFFESLEISDLICLLKLLDNPLQDIPLLAVLRSPLAGMSVAELAEIRAQETPENRAPNFWLAARTFLQRGHESSSAWRKLDVFFRQLDRWRELIRQTSLSHCLETALAETHYESLLRAGPRGEPQAANVRRLLDLAREYDPYQRQGLFRFLRFVEAQQELDMEPGPPPPNQDAVRLMSIHKSKGLEFPVVVVAGLGWLFNFRDLRENILLDEKYGLCPKIRPPDGEQSYPSLPFWLARRRQHNELLGEELRLLYVATTRARDTLLLAATATGKADPKWSAAPTREFSQQELLSARSYLDWLRLWLPQVTRDDEWKGNREGQSKLLRWTIYAEDDPRLALPEQGVAANEPGRAADILSAELESNCRRNVGSTPGLLEKLHARVNWTYPFLAATEQRAKTSVTELRRLHEEEAEPARFLQRIVFTLPARRSQGLTAAEIGTAHHHFLQRVSLSKVRDAEGLRSEAERLKRENWLSEAETAALDFAALARFWQSDFGRRVAAHAADVRRELPFTARFTAADLIVSDLEPPADLPADEFVVVQGMADLVVILPREIWLVDFKTDALKSGGTAEKVKLYEPQLKLYALALARIYGRPVTECWLHFLARAEPVRLEV